MTQPQIILGLNAFHADAAAALVVDGQVIVAAEEERFLRIKHWAGFPAKAIEFCLSEAGVGLAQVSAIAVNTDPSAARWRRIGYTLKARPSLKLIREKLAARRSRMGVAAHLKQAFPEQTFAGTVVPVEHHLAHLASAFECSPFEDALALSIDGFGDFASGAYGLGVAGKLQLDGHVWFPHSLGIYYQAMTQYLGFPNYGDEYKVMGLAPYGRPTLIEPLRRLLKLNSDGSYELALQFFRHHRESLAHQWQGGEPTFSALYSEALVDLLGPARVAGAPLEQHHKDLAASVQRVFEEAAFSLISALAERTQSTRLVLAGGCAQNSVANGKLMQETPIRELYVAASGADAGGAIGAALVAARQLGAPRTKPLTHAYLGPRYSNDQCERAIAAQSEALAGAQIRVQRVDDEASLCARVVERIVAGDVIGWFQGRMEWGARALGNRSILADPRRTDVQEILNRKIKRRESFRPFAPSVLREHTGAWFEYDADVPFMSLVFPVRPEKRALIPAVTHVDGSGRLQTVLAADNPRYHALISSFFARTGVPILLNTSFNENEPIVCTPQEALDCFLRTKMDVLVLGDWLLERPAVPMPAQERDIASAPTPLTVAG